MNINILRKLIIAILLLTLVIPQAFADNVTIHGTTGMLEAQLVSKTLEPVGTVEIWNTAMDMNIVIKPFSERCLLSKVYVYLDIEPAPPPVPEGLEDMMKDEHFQARGLFEQVDVNGESLKIPAMIPKLQKTPGRTDWAGPEVGAFNEEVYQGLLGLKPEQLDELRHKGVI